MSLRTLALVGCTRNLRIRKLSNFLQTCNDCDLEGSTLLQQFLGSEQREELKFGLPNRYKIQSQVLNIDGYSCTDVEILGYFIGKHSRTTSNIQNDPDNIFRLLTREGNLIHRLRVKPGQDRIENLEKGDLVLAKGQLSFRLKHQFNGQHYIPPIVVTNLLKMGRNARSNTYSYVTLFGRVLLKYFPISGPVPDKSDPVGQINMLTWKNLFNKDTENVYIQTNRVFINQATLDIFPFITHLEEGDHLMITGPLGYFNNPSVDTTVAAVNAKQVTKVDCMYTRREMIYQ